MITAIMGLVWDRLIRFVATDGRILRGEPILPSTDFDLGNTTEATKLQAKIITGSDLYDTSGVTKLSSDVVTVKRLLGPLAQDDVDILRCVGLNYAKHSGSTINRNCDQAANDVFCDSKGSGTKPSSISLHIFQADNLSNWSRRKCGCAKDSSRRPGRL